MPVARTILIVLGVAAGAAATIAVTRKVREILEAVRIVDVETVSVWSDSALPEE